MNRLIIVALMLTLFCGDIYAAQESSSCLVENFGDFYKNAVKSCIADVAGDSASKDTISNIAIGYMGLFKIEKYLQSALQISDDEKMKAMVAKFCVSQRVDLHYPAYTAFVFNCVIKSNMDPNFDYDKCADHAFDNCPENSRKRRSVETEEFHKALLNSLKRKF